MKQLLSFHPYFKKNITWNQNWISKFESPWGILEKIKYANFISANDLLHLWGIDKVRNIKNGIGRIHRNLYTLQGFDDILIQKSIGFSLYDHNNKALENVLGPFNNLKSNQEKYMRHDLYFCKECLLNGYHSIIFQFKLVKECPYHLIPLSNACINCNRPIQYTFSDEFTLSPFVCRCGHSWLSPNKTYTFWGSRNNYKINSKSLLRWLNLKSTEKAYFRRTFTFSGIELDQNEGILNNLLDVVDNNSISFHKFSTSTYLNNINITLNEVNESNLKSKYLSLKIKDKTWDMLFNNKKYYKQYEYIYNSSRKTVKSIMRKIRKSIYPEHKNCVKRLVGLLKEEDKPAPKICPYAFAYVFWKQSIDGLETFYEVDNFGYPDRGNKDSIETASVIDRLYVNDFIIKWTDIVHEMGVNKFAGLSWALDRLVGTLVLDHFYNWLNIAPMYADKLEVPIYNKFKYENLPFFLFKLPIEENEQIEFLLCNQNNYNRNINLECPYPTSKLKKIRSTEKKHTPLALAFAIYDTNSLGN